MNFDDVSYVGVPDDSECIVNAVQIGKVLDLAPHIIRSWADEFEDFLYVKKINGRMTYTEKSIRQFEWIKAMRDKGYGIKHIREQLKIKGFNYDNNDLGIINPNDVNLMESIRTDIGIEVKNQLKEFLKIFMEHQGQNNNELIKSLTSEVEQTVQDQLEDSMIGIQKELEEQKEANQKLLEQLNEVKEELALTKNTSLKVEEQLQDNFDSMSKKIIDENKESLEKLKNEIKYVSPEEINKYQEKNKSWISKIFNKK